MASRRRKKITIPLFPELKAEPFTELKEESPTEDEALKKLAKRELEEKYNLEPLDKYMCKACNIYLLYKNVNRHNETQCHLVNKKHNY
jgi:hypothetical protein